MSASSSRFPGHDEPAISAQGYESYDDPVDVPSSMAYARHDGGGYPSGNETTSDLYVPARKSDNGRKMKVTAPVVPPGSVTGRSLTLVIAIMCFLACLTAGAVWMIKESSDAWLKDISSEVTVQVTPQENADIEKAVADVVNYLEKQHGIVHARPLGLEESADLLQPWLGSGDALKSLPVPRLIAVEVDRNSPPDLTEVGSALKRDFKGASLDDHRRWQHQIRAVTRSLALGGLAILALVGAATTAIIVSATRSAMASNREIVEVLHFVGATDKFIAREFEKHFLRLGIKAGIVGATLAMLVFMGMPTITELLGGGAVSAVEVQRLIGAGSLDALGYIILGLVVVTIAGLCMITSRVGVYRILNGRH
ncbi:ABC transporter permease [Hyphomicrobium methylovorum]|uniref:cell division protein FtsX n=1 Tax=Hyphomicrobium methylovorum TaxID=84 RepID=UPI0015E6BBD5|nr:ABC transporter permease [Hyphomicrobium methylovorum]MBA2125739.1 ABC transporter permease [Hyphomicrobium methylovorum]